MGKMIGFHLLDILVDLMPAAASQNNLIVSGNGDRLNHNSTAVESPRAPS